jgi:hypothetical protein
MINEELSPDIKQLLQRVLNVNPAVADRWEVTAIIESLGYNDVAIAQEFNFPDTLSIGTFLYDYLNEKSTVGDRLNTSSHLYEKPSKEVRDFWQNSASSFIYAVPFLITISLDYLGNSDGRELLPPQLASLLAISTMASLTVTGGFVQAICRRGRFYLSLEEPLQAMRIAFNLLGVGIFFSGLSAVFGVLLGFYLNIAADIYIPLGAVYYTLLCLAWLFFAIVSLFHWWVVPVTLIGTATTFGIARILGKWGTVEANLLSISLALGFLSIVVAWIGWDYRKKYREAKKIAIPPKPSSLIYLLTPYFIYGTFYFCFIFADRLAAGIILHANSETSFAIAVQYQRSMDIALLCFLLLAPIVEYNSGKFVNYWYLRIRKAGIDDLRDIERRLHQRLRQSWLVSIVSGGILSTIAFGITFFLGNSSIDRLLVIFGCVGYLIFAVGISNSIILFSIDRANIVIKALLPAFLVNFISSYIAGSLFGYTWAGLGLILGSIVFLYYTTTPLKKAISMADFHYFHSGY